MQINLNDQLNSSFPADKEQLEQLITNDIGTDSLGLNAMQFSETIRLHYPIHIFAGRKSDKAH